MLQRIKELNLRRNRFLAGVVSTAAAEERLGFLGSSLYRNAVYLIIARLTLPLTGFVFWMVAARFYDVEDVGLASALIAAMGLLAVFSTLGLEFGLIRFLSYSKESVADMLNSCFTVTSLASIAFCGIFLGGITTWSPALLFVRQDTVFVIAFILFTLASTLTPVLNSAFIAERRAGFVTARALIFGLLRLPLPILLSLFFHTFGIFASWGLSLAVALLITTLFFLPRAQPGYRPFPAISKGVVNEMAHFSLANYIANLFWLTPTFILPVMVLNRLGDEPSAYFYITFAVGAMLFTIPLGTSMSLFAEGSYDEQRLGADARRSLKFAFLLLVPAVVLVLAIADKLLLLFGSSYSQSGTTLLRILALSSFPMAINYIYLSTKRVERKLAVLAGLSALIAIPILVLSYLLLPEMGIKGVGVAWLASHGLVAIGIIASFLLRRPTAKGKLQPTARR